MSTAPQALPPHRSLVLLRHGEAARPPATADADRDLTSAGRAESVAAGRWLASAAIVADLVLCSPATRTRRTWEHAATALAGTAPAPGALRLVAAAYNATAEELLRLLGEEAADERVVLLCGHNPGISGLVSLLDESATDPAGEPFDGLATGQVAVLEAPSGTSWDSLGPGRARLVRLGPANA